MKNMRTGKRKWTAMLVLIFLLGSLIPATSGFAGGSYAEDFDDNLAQGWSGTGGSWTATGGYYTNTTSVMRAISVYDNETWETDYTYSANVYSGYANSGNKVGAVYNYVDANNYYAVTFNPVGTAELRKVIGGTETTLATTSYSGGGYHVWFDLEISRSGDDTTIKVDGATVFGSVSQTELGAGKIGVIALWNIPRFDDISVTDNTGAVYKDTFPKIAGIYIGGGRNYHEATIQEDLAQHDLLLLGFWKGWAKGGKTIRQTVQEIKAFNPDLLVGQYTVVNENYSDPNNTATRDIYDKLFAEDGPGGIGDWWARTNTGDFVSSYPNTYNTNITDFVEPDANGDRYPQWLAKLNYAEMFQPVPEFDFVFSDNAMYKPRTDPDWDRDGINDSQNDPVVQAYFRTGMTRYWDTLMDLMPDKLIMGNVDGHGGLGLGYLREPEYRYKLPAALLEGAIGKSWSEETWSTWQATMGNYQSLIDHTISPNLVVFNVHGDVDNYALMRYGLASALLEDGYYSYSAGGTYNDGLIGWYDEFDVDLGEALEGPQRSPWSNGVYRRLFENGMALVNPKGNGTQTVTIGPGYERIDGTQDPTVNDGSAVTSITLGERQGIILLKP